MQLKTNFLHISEETTQPVPQAVALAFQKYLDHHALTIRDAAQASHVRLLVVWNILHGNPIQRQDANKIRSGLFLLTKVPYDGPIMVHAKHAFPYQKARPQFTQAFAQV